MLCSPTTCGCSFESVGMQISVGAQGQIILEPAGPGIVTLKSEVISPFLGQTIVETSTGRLYWYDGTNWVIYGGNMPRVSVTRITNLAINSGVAEPLTFPVEVYDTDGFHSASSDLFTVPAGLGGDYRVEAETKFAPNSVGYRLVLVNIGTNTSQPNEILTLRGGNGAPPAATGNNFEYLSKDVRLEAGATVFFLAFHAAGGTLDVTRAWATMTMTNHIPSLV